MINQRKCLLFGFPIDSLAPEDMESVFLEMLQGYAKDMRPRFGTTVNALVLGLTSGWPFSARDPEMMQLLRSADFVGLDSSVLTRFSSLLGNPILPISSDNLLLQAALFCAKHKKRVFLIGGDETLCKKTAQALKSDIPGLNICGCSAPKINTKGLPLESSIQRDPLILEELREAKPDVLLIQLGHPKQDVWFARVANQLHIPLSLGVGGAFERYLNKRADTKAEGDYSLSSLKRKVVTALRFGLWIPSLFLYNTVNRLLYDLIFRHIKHNTARRGLFLSEKEALSVIPFPTYIHKNTWSKKPEWIDEAMEHDHIVLDLQRVQHLDPAGLGLLYSTAKTVSEAGKNLFLLGITADLRCFLKVNGAWDLFAPYACTNSEDVLDRLFFISRICNKKEHDFVSIYQSEEQTVISFFGRINCVENGDHELLNIKNLIDGKDTSIDLKYCTRISNRGFGFLLQLRSHTLQQGSKLTIIDASRQIKKQFSQAKLKSYFTFG